MALSDFAAGPRGGAAADLAQIEIPFPAGIWPVEPRQELDQDAHLGRHEIAARIDGINRQERWNKPSLLLK